MANEDVKQFVHVVTSDAERQKWLSENLPAFVDEGAPPDIDLDLDLVNRRREAELAVGEPARVVRRRCMHEPHGEDGTSIQLRACVLVLVCVGVIVHTFDPADAPSSPSTLLPSSSPRYPPSPYPLLTPPRLFPWARRGDCVRVDPLASGGARGGAGQTRRQGRSHPRGHGSGATTSH